MSHSNNQRILLLTTFLSSLLFSPDCAHAYIGPGAGFAFLGSGSVLILALLFFIVTISFLPFRFVAQQIRAMRRGAAQFKRVVIVGLDGLDPKLVERMIDEGKLPNLAKLRDDGSYSRLGTTLPALSPVAWSTFQTGVNPGAHNIFDFVTRDKRFCVPQLSSSRTSIGRREIGIGKLRIAFGKKTRFEILRRGIPFWKILTKHGIAANVIRVPISYPPESFAGNILSAMCTPDLRGSQGTFTLFSTAKTGELSEGADSTGGRMVLLQREGDVFRATIEGPPDSKNAGKYLGVEFSIRRLDGTSVEIDLPSGKTILKLGEFSDWIPLSFRMSRFAAVSGIVRLSLREIEPNLVLYVSPVNVDPQSPALPVSEPRTFSMWLSGLIGRFGTLGLMEDTWGRNEKALDDEAFLKQTYLNHGERERMFFETLKRTREGLCACVFDASDRIQHMFWRYLDPKHPARVDADLRFSSTIEDMYINMDGLVGRIREQLTDRDLLMVLSDHGFSSFRRCVNLNTWLMENGYLGAKSGQSGSGYLQDVDWAKTRAFGVGLTGIYLNRQGRESQGVVPETEVDALCLEIAAKLEALVDPESGEKPIRKAYPARRVYKGLYVDEAPDLILGYTPGYRVSWDSVTGGLEAKVFSDNVKAWSGDHHVDPSEVPGILFLNRPLAVEKPHIRDLAPTTLTVFGLKPPAHMEGRSILAA